MHTGDLPVLGCINDSALRLSQQYESHMYVYTILCEGVGWREGGWVDYGVSVDCG